MQYVAKSGFLARVAIGVAMLAGLAGQVRADAINFVVQPSQQVSTLDVGGVTISGSNTLVINSGDGLGILGGIPGFAYGNYTIDPTESITFHFDSGPAADIVLSARGAGTLGNAPISAQGESLIEAFNQAGKSLGTVDLIPSSLPLLAFNISTAFSDQPISSFRLQPKGDAANGAFVNLGGLSYAAIPEPSSLVGWCFGTLIVLGHALRKR